MFSVLISVYYKDSASFFKESLQSVFIQTIIPNEVILVKDGPLNNGLNQLIEQYVEMYPGVIKVVSLEKNMGLGYALSIGLKHCSYELVARMDSDDICHFDRFRRQLEYLEKKPNVSVVGTTIEEFKFQPGDLKTYRKLPEGGRQLLAFSKFRNPLNHPSVIFKKTEVLAAGSYEDMPLFEDFYLWVKMLKKGFIIENIEEPLLYFRVGNNMIGRRHGISYLMKEFKFLSAVKKIKFINNKEYIVSLFIKLPLRIIPKNILKILYHFFLR